MTMSVKQRVASFFIPLTLLLVFGVYKVVTDHETIGGVFQRPSQVAQIQDIAKKVLGTKDERGFEQAVVLKVIDGDTIELSDGRKVRYVGMDTPELHHPQKGVQCFGAQAYERNRSLVEGKIVQMEKDVSETDKYGRLLRYIWIDNILINKQLVRDGFAFAKTFPPDVARQDELRSAGTMAQVEKKGLWSGCQVDVKKKQTQEVN